MLSKIFLYYSKRCIVEQVLQLYLWVLKPEFQPGNYHLAHSGITAHTRQQSQKLLVADLHMLSLG